MSYNSIMLVYDHMRSANSSTFDGSFHEIGAPIPNDARILKIVNNSGTDIQISTDGSNTMDYIPTGGFSLYDAGANRSNGAPTMVFPAGTQFFVAGGPSSGLVYLVTLYAQPYTLGSAT